MTPITHADVLTSWISDFRSAMSKFGIANGQFECETIKSASTTYEWCVEKNEPPAELENKLRDLLRWHWDFHDALRTGPAGEINQFQHLQRTGGKSAKGGYWSHQELEFLLSLGKLATECSYPYKIDVAELATQYIRCPWMQTQYLDWILLDAMLCAEIYETSEYIKVNSKPKIFGFSHYTFS